MDVYRLDGTDVNTIENAWGKLKMELPTYFKSHDIVIRNGAHFQIVLQATWEHVTTYDYLKTLCTTGDSKRLLQVIQKQGRATSYQGIKL